MNSQQSPSFVGALIGDGRPLIIFTALALVFSGIGAIFLSVTGHFLPHDVEFLGMQPAALCELNQCRIVHFMIHDRMSFGGVLLAIAALYLWLAMFPLKEGESWAWWTLALTNASGFGSFLAYIGYGYLDHWHACATGGLLPVALWGLWKTRKLCTRPLDLRPAWAAAVWREPAAWCRLPWFGWAFGMIAAGATILIVGMTHVFVPSDLSFIGYTRDQLNAINPRLIPLIAHDRAGFGGGVLTTGLLVLAIVWKAPLSKHLWQALVIAGLAGFGCAIGVHYPIQYLDPWHLAPAWAGAAVFAVGAWWTWGRWKASP
ncbi:hypothetical protein [Haloferula sp. BvORR071]|uniref:hypothetical protein n=1 Tax=Haloferula sp. BvORR071 TaxID=1396141 RepID=UPI0006973D99|nr:hypothetical protein [Haloferula sp. BvORR071]